MANLHATSLFHFTSINNLIGILTDNFFPKYSKERFYFNNSHWDYWIPIVCFCDIPLSLISEHINEYGQYGIGMSREWADASKLNPVFYYKENSIFHEKFNTFMSMIHSNDKEIIQTFQQAKLNSKYLFHYYKSSNGHNFKTNKNKWFYDEREWRYVPYIEDKIDLIEFDDDENFHKKKTRKDLEMKKYQLNFKPNDINYIILSKETERLDFIKKIRTIKYDRYHYTTDEVDILTSKILTVEQMSNDF